MGKINVGRLIMGGIVAGIAIDLLDYLVDGVWLAPRWAAEMALLGRPGFSQIQIVLFNVIGLLTGLVAAFMHVAHLFSAHLTLYTTLGGLVEVVFGTLAGASVYRET